MASSALAVLAGCLALLAPAVGCRPVRLFEASPQLPSPIRPSSAHRATPNRIPSPQNAAGLSASNTPDQQYTADSEAIFDEPDDADNESDVGEHREHPFATLSDAELNSRLKTAPDSLGSASLGRPNAGALFGGAQLPENAAWKRVDPSHAWGTPETIEYLTSALLSVDKRYSGTPAVSIGHLSAQKGGPLRPHVSHQSGRDVDVGFYYKTEPSRWYLRATVDNLDLERTWWFVRTLVLETKIEMILLDQSLIDVLERYAHNLDEPVDLLESAFHRRGGHGAILRHAPGHATHLHLRFFNPVAQESGRRLMPLLVSRGLVSAPQRFVTHVALAGDTLAKLATHYATTMQAIRQANSMTTYQLVAGRTYRIPVPGSAASTPSIQGAPARKPGARASKRGRPAAATSSIRR